MTAGCFAQSVVSLVWHSSTSTKNLKTAEGHAQYHTESELTGAGEAGHCQPLLGAPTLLLQVPRSAHFYYLLLSPMANFWRERHQRSGLSPQGHRPGEMSAAASLIGGALSLWHRPGQTHLHDLPVWLAHPRGTGLERCRPRRVTL